MAGRMKLYEKAPRISPKMTHRGKNLARNKIRLLSLDQSNSVLCEVFKSNTTTSTSTKYKGIGPISIRAFCKAVSRKTKRPSQNSFSFLLLPSLCWAVFISQKITTNKGRQLIASDSQGGCRKFCSTRHGLSAYPRGFRQKSPPFQSTLS